MSLDADALYTRIWEEHWAERHGGQASTREFGVVFVFCSDCIDAEEPYLFMVELVDGVLRVTDGPYPEDNSTEAWKALPIREYQIG